MYILHSLALSFYAFLSVLLAVPETVTVLVLETKGVLEERVALEESVGTVNLVDAVLRTAETDPKLALSELADLVDKEPELLVHCHEYAHEIGRRAYIFLQEEAFGFRDPMCGTGYLHGAIAEAVRSYDVSTSLLVHEWCEGELLESCLHGMGHAVFAKAGDVTTAIDMCSSITTRNTDCYDGIFMSIFDTEALKSRTSMLVAEAEMLCNSVREEAKPSCYFYLPRLLTDSGSEIVALMCVSIQDVVSRSACAQGSGVMFMKYEKTFNQEAASELCASYQDVDMEKLCLKGVTNYASFGSVENIDW